MTYCTSRKLSVKLLFSFDVNKEKTPHDTLKERISSLIIPLTANPTKWSSTLKQFVGKLLEGLSRLASFPSPMNILPFNNIKSKDSK